MTQQRRTPGKSRHSARVQAPVQPRAQAPANSRAHAPARPADSERAALPAVDDRAVEPHDEPHDDSYYAQKAIKRNSIAEIVGTVVTTALGG